MVFLIIESTFMLNIFKKNVKFQNGIKLFSTKGHLFNYLFNKKKIEYFLKEDKQEIVSFFREIDSSKNIIIIASDHDAAGELIAFEIASFFKKAKILRFSKPIEEILKEKNITKEYLFKYATSKINILKGIRYLEERFLSDYNKERIKVLSALNQKEITRIPFKE